jgi:hypothetical protein
MSANKLKERNGYLILILVWILFIGPPFLTGYLIEMWSVWFPTPATATIISSCNEENGTLSFIVVNYGQQTAEINQVIVYSEDKSFVYGTATYNPVIRLLGDPVKFGRELTVDCHHSPMVGLKIVIDIFFNNRMVSQPYNVW